MTSKHVIVDGVECKVCSRCHETKPLSEFGRRAMNRDGLHEACKKCNNASCIRGQKLRKTREHAILIWVPKTDYKEFDNLAKIAKMDTGSMIRAIVLEWLESTRGNKEALQ